jgi:hypothetical protein
LKSYTRWFVWPQDVVTQPLPIEGVEASNFGVLLQALLRCYQLGWAPEQFQPADSWTLPHGIRFGRGLHGYYAIYERQSLGEIEGALVIDRIEYRAPYMKPSLAYPPVEHGTFIPVARLKLIGEALGTPPAELAGASLPDEYIIDPPVSVAVGRPYTGANLDFNSTTLGEA